MCARNEIIQSFSLIDFFVLYFRSCLEEGEMPDYEPIELQEPQVVTSIHDIKAAL